LNTAEYLPESNEMAKQYLYKKLNENPSLMNGETSLQAFYASHSADEINALNAVRGSIDGLTYYDNYFSSAIESMGHTYEGLRDTIIILDSLFMASNYTDQAVVAAKEAVIDQMNTLSASISALMIQRESLRNNQVVEAITENNGVTSTGIPETNEHLINGIYLETIASGINTFTNGQVSVIQDIAHQCPFSGGRAVYQARSIYKLIDPNEEYDDVNTCLNGGIYRKGKSDSAVPTLNLYPNPARESVTVDLDTKGKDGCMLIVSDLSENIVKRITLPCDQATYTLDISDISNGMYMIRVLSNQVLIGKAKLGVSK